MKTALVSLKALVRQGFIRNVGVLASGTIAGQAVMFLILPVLTRLYQPDAFGLLGVYMSILMIISIAACLRLELAIPLPEEDSDAINLLALCVIAATIVAAVLGLTVLLAPDIWVRVLDQPDMRPFLWFIPIGVWLAAIYSAIQFWSIRKGRYAELARTQLTRAIGGSGFQAGYGAFFPSAFGLLLGHVIYTGTGTAGLARLLWKHDRALIAKIGAKTMLQNLSRQRRFPLYSVPEALLNSVAINAPIVLIAALVGKQEAGYMLLAQRVGSIPVGLVGGSISRVYLAEAAKRRLTGDLGSFTRRIMRFLLATGIGPFLVLALAAPMIFPVFFGEEWLRAGEMVSWLVPCMLLQFVASPVSTVLHATGNQFGAMLLQTYGFILLIGSILIAHAIGSAHVFEFFAVAAAIYYGTYVGVILFLSRD